jgi:hypothetical protein
VCRGGGQQDDAVRGCGWIHVLLERRPESSVGVGVHDQPGIAGMGSLSQLAF